MVKARKLKPLSMSADKNGNASRKTKASDVIFLMLSSSTMQVDEFAITVKGGP